MAIEYVNRRGQTYYLHQGTTKAGKPHYFFSMKAEGGLADAIPDGFETYESPNGPVFLRIELPDAVAKALSQVA